MLNHQTLDARTSVKGLPSPRRGPLARWPRAADRTLAVIVLAIEVATALSRVTTDVDGFGGLARAVPLLSYLLIGAGSVALLWRRKLPLVAMTTSLAALLIWHVADFSGGPFLAILISMYSVGRYTEEDLRTVVGVVVAMIVVGIADVVDGDPSPAAVGLSLLLVAVPWYIGRRIRHRGQYLAILEDRAAYLEKERAAEALRAVVEERTRIARELHDVVAHQVSMMTVQAGAAQTVVADDPQRAIRAMAAVEGAGREALDELRHLLGVLRPETEQENLAPLPGLADVSRLVAQMGEAGLEVSFSTSGATGDLQARVDLSAYRIIQEALTNVIKHAGPSARAEVHVSAIDQVLTIEVADNGSGSALLPGSGQGLVGIRERAALLGGSLEAGVKSGGGFQVLVRLPMEREPS